MRPKVHSGSEHSSGRRGKGTENVYFKKNSENIGVFYICAEIEYADYWTSEKKTKNIFVWKGDICRNWEVVELIDQISIYVYNYASHLRAENRNQKVIHFRGEQQCSRHTTIRENAWEKSTPLAKTWGSRLRSSLW